MNSIIICIICNIRFANVEQKQEHYEQHHQLRYLKYCKACNVYIYCLTSLRKHKLHKKHLVTNPSYPWKILTSNVPNNDFKCNFCSKTFRGIEELEKHYREICSQVARGLKKRALGL